MSTVFDAGDYQRIEREARLTEQLPRVQPEEDRSPIEEPVVEENPFELMLDAFAEVLKRSI